jgi:hypothetical protein
MNECTELIRSLKQRTDILKNNYVTLPILQLRKFRLKRRDISLCSVVLCSIVMEPSQTLHF